MKKIFSIMLAAMMLLTLAACGTNSTAGNTDNNSGEPASAGSADSDPTGEVPSETPEATPDEAPESTGGKTLIAYFSWSGNTAKLAQMIADASGGELFAVEPETPYPDDYNTVVDQAKTEQKENARPTISNTVENWDDYDTVFVGYPNWWGDVPMIMLTFMESYDWSGKTVIPFCTSGGGGFGNGVTSITDAASGASVLDGFHVNDSRVDGAQEDVTSWLDGLGL